MEQNYYSYLIVDKKDTLANSKVSKYGNFDKFYTLHKDNGSHEELLQLILVYVSTLIREYQANYSEFYEKYKDFITNDPTPYRNIVADQLCVPSSLEIPLTNDYVFSAHFVNKHADSFDIKLVYKDIDFNEIGSISLFSFEVNNKEYFESIKTINMLREQLATEEFEMEELLRLFHKLHPEKSLPKSISKRKSTK